MTTGDTDDFLDYVEPTPDEEWTVEEADLEEYSPSIPWTEEESELLSQSVPGLRGVTLTCVESLAAPLWKGNLLPIGVCDNVGDVDCLWLLPCGYHYRDPDGCAGNCVSNDTARLVRRKRRLVNTAPWPKIACAAAMISGAADTACLIHYGPAIPNCDNFWPAPKPTTTCK
ncbi:MAG: hypothetical protein R3B09_26305 [Nannocystaceae bacterium]